MFLDLAKQHNKISPDGSKVALFAEKCKISQTSAPLYPNGKRVSAINEVPAATTKELNDLGKQVEESENHIK